MTTSQLEIPTIDARQTGFESDLDALRTKLSPSGNVVSPKGRELTERVFGEALLPSQVVERICAEVESQGRSALEKYTSALDNHELGSELRFPA